MHISFRIDFLLKRLDGVNLRISGPDTTVFNSVSIFSW